MHLNRIQSYSVFKRSIRFSVHFFFFTFTLCLSNAFANLIGNSGFEDQIGSGTNHNWDNTNGATRVSSATAVGLGFSAVPEGNFALRIQTTAQFTFQTFDQIQPGDFVSFSARAESAIAAANGGELVIEFKKLLPDNSDFTISSVTSTRITSTNANPGVSNFPTFTVTGVAPPETGRVVFTLREVGANGNVLFDAVNAEVNPEKLLAVSASKTHVKRGDVVTVFAQFFNASGGTLNNTELRAELPRGIDFLPQSVRLNGNPAVFREGSLIIPVGNIAPLQTHNTSFQILVTTGVSVGKSIDIGLLLTNGINLSERGSVRLIVKNDPVFDEGTIIGKVFQDTNQNSVQDPGEEGLPFIRLVTEEGIVIITDEDGQYHIPGMKPGRHLVKIDGHSLPEGSKIISEPTYLVKTTPGILSKANFAVLIPPSRIPEQFQKDLAVSITQGLDTSRPDLEVAMDPPLLKVGLGRMEKEPAFKFTINYPEFVKNWKLEIRDEVGREVWTGFGVAAPPSEVVWSGQAENGLIVKSGIYSYQFKVQDKAGREDWTPIHFFRVISKTDADVENASVVIPSIGDFNIMKDGKQSIPLIAKPTIRVHGRTHPGSQVAINSRPVDVDPDTGSFSTEVYTTPGEKEILVTATNPEGESTSYRETVTVKDSTFFMVALGEEQLGENFQTGNIETAGEDKALKDGFYQDGRLSYYLRGKLKGKFAFQSHYDTDDKRSVLFTNMDPEDYYPIYGDTSKRDYEARDTLDRFYLLVEMDRSFIKYGSFKTAFNDTELATYNRTLTGFKGSFETLASTKYGDPQRAVKAFATKSKHKADHNEFAATGGSLYYLRNRRIIEGSEKLRVEVRDKIQDMTVESRELVEGKDYEIDYDEGRIMLSRPLSSVAASDTIISRDLLDGNPVFLIVDYEFDADLNTFDTDNGGVRAYTHLGDHLRVGGTAVEEQRQNQDYDMRGLDAEMKFGRNTRVIAEYAHANDLQTHQSISYNGGLSFADVGLLHGKRPRQKAYLFKGETKPVKNLEITSYLQDVEPGFSNDHIMSQEGLKKYGAQSRFKFTDYFYVTYRFDANELVSQLRPVNERGVSAPFEKVHSHTAQVTYDDGKYLAQAEYLRQTQDLPILALQPSLLSEIPFKNGLAGKLGYHLNERLLPYLKVQATMQGKPDHQFGGGVQYEISQQLFGYIEEMIGNLGDSTNIGFERFHQGGARSYANLRMIDNGTGHNTVATAIGSSFSLTERSRVYSEREYSDYRTEDGYADILGYDGRLGDNWDYDIKFERRHFDNSRTRLLDTQAEQSVTRTNTFNTISWALGYADHDKMRIRTSWEYRRDQDSPRLFQWVTRDSVEYKINRDLSFLGKLDFGKSRFLDPDDTAALFTELNLGYSYRPVAHDKLNVLTRYTFVKDIANDIQFATEFFRGVETDETAHIFAIDIAYDLYKYLGVVEKFAYKKGIFGTAVSDDVVVNTLLWVNRLNFHVTRKWDVAAEYRALWQAEAADSLRHGALVEVDREFYDYVRLGLGYNFTDFDDDLRSTNDYNSHGPFVRMTGKF